MKKYIRLMRLDKPIGIFLLFWPCAWGLALANAEPTNNLVFFKYLILFLIGSILMRSAGCVYNDIVDRKIDIKITRTKNRPIATGLIPLSSAWMLILILISFSLIILFQFNLKSIIFGLGSAFLVLLYPFMKRITYWPQLFLGITFNYGLILAWISIANEISIIPIIFYLGAIFWTLGYDTIYGFQDIKDDEIIGVKSTSIKFKNDPKKFLFISYCLFIISLFLVGILMKFRIYYFLFMIIPILQLLVFQVKKLNINQSFDCLSKFKSNNFLGLMIFVNILIGKLI